MSGRTEYYPPGTMLPGAAFQVEDMGNGLQEVSFQGRQYMIASQIYQALGRELTPEEGDWIRSDEAGLYYLGIKLPDGQGGKRDEYLIDIVSLAKLYIRLGRDPRLVRALRRFEAMMNAYAPKAQAQEG
jgi:hypothetical protein